LLVRLAMQEMMQLARAYTRLAQPHTLYVVSHLFTLRATLIGNAVALVVGLAADTQKLASPDDAQPFDLSLREDLPGRFFTIDTP
jgi:hypothetical protein